ncbi:MAG TPA: ATP-binding protein, partial [Methanomicrobiales archaeon]|nr:ATP-binding protein [Methanomicrobiales archaeon]
MESTENGNQRIEDEQILGGLELAASSEIEVPPKLIDQVIGQEHAVEVIRKAAVQRRHVMMIGSPGTGKSMLAKAMAELLPKEELQDILVYPNSEDNNNPIIRTVTAGRGKQIVTAHKAEAKRKMQTRNTLIMLFIFGIVAFAFLTYQWLMGIIAATFVFMALRYTTPREDLMVPKLP